MGLTSSSVGRGAADSPRPLKKQGACDRVIALAGNPNVGKSTVFNGLTGLRQHTGNWPGKTVTSASGYCRTPKSNCILVDLPGTYSLLAHSAEEEVARDFLCFSRPDLSVVICDATNPERTLGLALQVMECSAHTVIVFNLMDEAARKKIFLDLPLFEKRLGVPVIGLTARRKRDLRELLPCLDTEQETPNIVEAPIPYPKELEEILIPLERTFSQKELRGLRPRWLALHLLDGDAALQAKLRTHLGESFWADDDVRRALSLAKKQLSERNISPDGLKDRIAASTVKRAEDLCRGAVRYEANPYSGMDRRLDRLLTGKFTAYPFMLLLLLLTFFLTITLANYPSAWLSETGDFLLNVLREKSTLLGAPPWLRGLFIDGILKVLFWVVSVMLPPMAIFFPLFTLLEDVGYLPRVAYNLDHPFHKCNACGKQSLTMCMGFGCNAAGVVGCRIIDSPRERLLAILTNSLVPCNGRFPALIAILTMFFVLSSGILGSLLSAALLTLLILFSILMTFLATRLLSVTLLGGIPSSFTLELPPYRKPQVGKVIVRSILDRTLFVLGRSVAVAAPAGMVIWCLANITVHDASLLSICADFLDPFARLMGMDGIILMAFILALPANEIVIPIITMAYLSAGTLTETATLSQMKELFVANGWTRATAVSVLIFFLLHWPCSTTLLTIKKETGSLKWTALAALLPTVMGMLICMLFTAVVRGFGL